MEKIINEKEQAAKMTVVPLEALRISTIPTTISSTTRTGDATDQLENTIQNISLQIEEIKRLQTQVNILQDHQTKTGTFHAAKL